MAASRSMAFVRVAPPRPPAPAHYHQYACQNLEGMIPATHVNITVSHSVPSSIKVREKKIHMILTCAPHDPVWLHLI